MREGDPFPAGNPPVRRDDAPCIRGPSGEAHRNTTGGAACKCESVRRDRTVRVMWAHGKWKGRGQITSQALVLGEASSICHPRMNCGRYRFDYQVPLPSPSPLPPQSIGFYCDIIWMPARTRRSRPSRLLYMYSCSVWGGSWVAPIALAYGSGLGWYWGFALECAGNAREAFRRHALLGGHSLGMSNGGPSTAPVWLRIFFS